MALGDSLAVVGLLALDLGLEAAVGDLPEVLADFVVSAPALEAAVLG